MKKTFITLLCIPLFLCGCRNTSSQEETQTIVYNIIEDGTEATREVISYGEGMLDVPPEMNCRYGYNLLDDDEKNIYDLIYNALSKGEAEVQIPNILEDNTKYSYILDLVKSENFGFFYVDERKLGTNSIASQNFSVEFTYIHTPDEAKKMLDECEAKADEIISGMNSDFTDYEKVKYIHDYLIINSEKDENAEYSGSIYGALIEKKARCEGYAKAFSYLCNIVGIENVIVTGQTTEAHMWNMVKIDGNWYNLDVTWNFPATAISKAYPDAVLYTYFLISDSEISLTHTKDSLLFEFPRATGSAMSYFYHEGMYADSYESALEIIENGCRKAVEQEKHSFMIKLSSKELCEDVINRLASRDEYDTTAIADTMRKAGYEGNISYTDMYINDRILLFLMD